MKDPLAKVPLNRPLVVPFTQPIMKKYHVKNPFLEYSPYNHNLKPTYQDLSYMLGEQFFKEQAGGNYYEDSVNFQGDEEHEDQEQIPYEVIKNYVTYEKRHIPSAVHACVQEKVDVAADPFAGLRFTSHKEYVTALKTDRYQKLPSTRMFNQLFKYINGENDRKEKINMTRPVTILHHVERRDYLGNFEIQEECFYLPSIYQENHDHGPSPRHVSVGPPQPLEDSEVYLHTRPEMDIYARTFGGFPVTEEDWEAEKKILVRELGAIPHHDNEYFAACYQSPWKMSNRRNEIWVQSIEPGHPVISAILADTYKPNNLEDEHEQDADVVHSKKAPVEGKQKAVKKEIES